MRPVFWTEVVNPYAVSLLISDPYQGLVQWNPEQGIATHLADDEDLQAYVNRIRIGESISRNVLSYKECQCRIC